MHCRVLYPSMHPWHLVSKWSRDEQLSIIRVVFWFLLVHVPKRTSLFSGAKPLQPQGNWPALQGWSSKSRLCIPASQPERWDGTWLGQSLHSIGTHHRGNQSSKAGQWMARCGAETASLDGTAQCWPSCPGKLSLWISVHEQPSALYKRPFHTCFLAWSEGDPPPLSWLSWLLNR